MPQLISDQRTDEWLGARMGRITASLAAACLGLDSHKSRAAAWREITGTGKQKQNRAMRWGQENEPKARAAYEVLTGNIVEETGFWVHPLYDWLGASPDGLIGDIGLLECKCPANLPPEVPVPHRIQCMVQLAVTGRLWCDYVAWVDDDHHFLQRIDRRGLAGLLHRLKQFYRAFVETGIEPPKRARRKKR